MTGGLGPETPGGSFNHAAFSGLLRKHVDANGFVNYGGFQNDRQLLDTYLQTLAESRPAGLSRYEQLALYINAYNAFTIRLILDHAEVESIRDIPTAKRWQGRTWVVGGEALTLDALEHDVIRRRFKENRIHFALVCASIGCPSLKSEAYTGAKLVQQLDEQTRRFLARPSNCSWHADTNTMVVSSIFDWYIGDFGGPDGLPAFIEKYAPPEIIAMAGSFDKQSRIRFGDYNWRLNGTFAQR